MCCSTASPRWAYSLAQHVFELLMFARGAEDVPLGRQAVFVLVMLVACVMALTHPVWQYWYEKIVPPLLIIMMILALDYAMRK